MGKNPDFRTIDWEVRRVVKLFNSFSYIQTTSSCSGHYWWETLDTKNGPSPYIEYKALSIEAYFLTQKLIDGISKRQSKNLDECDIFDPCAEIHEGSSIIFTTHQPPVLIAEEVKKGLLKFWSHLDYNLIKYSKLERLK